MVKVICRCDGLIYPSIFSGKGVPYALYLRSSKFHKIQNCYTLDAAFLKLKCTKIRFWSKLCFRVWRFDGSYFGVLILSASGVLIDIIVSSIFSLNLSID